MSELSTHTKLHRRITNFVDWIKPDPDKRNEIKERANKVREKIKNQAESEKYGYTVVSTPNAGSFTTKSGLRRHLRGEAEVEGLDVDLPFVVKDDDESFLLPDLLNDFYNIVDDCYPDTTKERTKSSIKLKFADGVNMDIVPMLDNEREDHQTILRLTGEKVDTSVKKHVEFIKNRTRESDNQAGRVKFNECLRLLKWWRDHQAVNSYYLNGDDSPPSFLINLLAAKAFDQLSVEKTYAETLAKWFGYLAHIVRSQENIIFNDFESPSSSSLYGWSVIDPVNPSNNVVSSWSSVKISELADWLERGRDNWNRVIRFDEDEEDSKSLDQLVNIFGNSFKNHCD